MMAGLEVRGMDALLENLDAVLEENAEEKRRLHAALSVRLKDAVDAEISLSVQDENGHVRGWQEPSVGSGGGYAAVRPEKGQTGPDSPGAVTNYLENGHRIRGSERRARAFGFYAAARQKAKGILLEEAERFAAELGGKLS